MLWVIYHGQLCGTQEHPDQRNITETSFTRIAMLGIQPVTPSISGFDSPDLDPYTSDRQRFLRTAR